MNDSVDTLEVRSEAVARHIRLDIARLREPSNRHPSRDRDDLLDARVGRESRDNTRPHGARRACDRNAH